MRVLISGGGTGGHVYPALAVAAQLEKAIQVEKAAQQNVQPQPKRQQPNEHPLNEHQRSEPAKKSQHASPQPLVEQAHDPLREPQRVADILWIGSVDGMEKELVLQAGIGYFGITAGKFNVNLFVAIRSLSKLLRGFWQSWQKISQFQPDICLVTGGYVCPAVVAVCRLKRIPVLVYLPDMTPGWAIRGLSYLAQRVAISFPNVAHFFGGEAPQGKAIVTGYPVRAALVEAAADRTKARDQLAQALDRPSLLVEKEEFVPLVLIWGGSQGARSINRATWAMLADVLPHAHILHVIGTRDWPLYTKEAESDVEALPDQLQKCYHPVAYLHSEMTLALAAADVSIARAGASTLGEFPVAKLPSILVPLPFAGVNQSGNAEELADRGGAIIVDDSELSAELAPKLLALLADKERRQQMENALGEMAMPNAALKIAQALVEMSRIAHCEGTAT